jgi:hypothetical protein
MEAGGIRRGGGRDQKDGQKGMTRREDGEKGS